MADTTWAGTFPPVCVSFAYAGTIVYPPGGRFGARIQHDYQLVLVHTGRVDLTVDGAWQAIPPGNIALLKPGHAEEFTFAKDQHTWHRWISVHFDSLGGAGLGILALEQALFSIPISGDMNQITDLMISLLKTGHTVESPVVKLLGLSALELFISESARLETTRSIHPSVLVVKQLIHNQYEKEITLQQLAHQSNLSQQHLNRLFHRYEGLTPIQYLWRYRVEQGIERLLKTGLTISEIALQGGFKTSYHFARLIRQHTGRTPSELRKGNKSI